MESWLASFRERLIHAAEEASASDENTLPAAATTESSDVLIVHNERVVPDTLVTILNMHGYKAFAAYSGSEAVHMARELRPWLVLCDLIMRDMNGIETAVRITTAQPKCRVVLFSAQRDIRDIVSVAESLGHRFEIYSSPIHPQDLLEQMKKMKAAL